MKSQLWIILLSLYSCDIWPVENTVVTIPVSALQCSPNFTTDSLHWNNSPSSCLAISPTCTLRVSSWHKGLKCHSDTLYWALAGDSLFHRQHRSPLIAFESDSLLFQAIALHNPTLEFWWKDVVDSLFFAQKFLHWILQYNPQNFELRPPWFPKDVLWADSTLRAQVISRKVSREAYLAWPLRKTALQKLDDLLIHDIIKSSIQDSFANCGYDTSLFTVATQIQSQASFPTFAIPSVAQWKCLCGIYRDTISSYQSSLWQWRGFATIPQGYFWTSDTNAQGNAILVRILNSGIQEIAVNKSLHIGVAQALHLTNP